MTDSIVRRIERIEERINVAERDMSSISSKLHLIKDDISRRVDEISTSHKTDSEKLRLDLRERINDLKIDIKDDIVILGQTISTLGVTVNDVSKSVHNLYVKQQGSGVKVNINEKIIWGVVAVLSSIGLYLLQNFIKAGGAG